MDLLEHEAVLDAVVEDGGSGGGGEAAVVDDAPLVETPPAEAPGVSFDDPAFLEAVAAVVDARTPAPAPAATATEPPDWNDYLNPLGDNYGQNMATFLADRDKWLLSQIEERFQPVLNRTQAEEQTANQEAYDKVVADRVKAAGLPATAAPVVSKIATANYTALAAQYGDSRRTADIAMSEAIKTVNELAAETRQSGVVSNIDGLAAVAAAAAEPGTGGGALDVPPAARTPRELMSRRFGLTPAA